MHAHRRWQGRALLSGLTLLTLGLVSPALSAQERGPAADAPVAEEAPHRPEQAANSAPLVAAPPPAPAQRWPSPYEAKAGVRVEREAIFGQLHHPLGRGWVAVPFGDALARLTKTRVRHTGWTLRGPVGEPVRSAAAGLVVFAGALRGYGLTVIVDHGGGYHTVYAHLKQLDVRADQLLARGDHVGLLGRTGSLEGDQLYFELREHGRPIDPEGWCVSPRAEGQRAAK